LNIKYLVVVRKLITCWNSIWYNEISYPLKKLW